MSLDLQLVDPLSDLGQCLYECFGSKYELDGRKFISTKRNYKIKTYH